MHQKCTQAGGSYYYSITSDTLSLNNVLHSCYFKSYTRSIIVNIIILLIRMLKPKEIKCQFQKFLTNSKHTCVRMSAQVWDLPLTQYYGCAKNYKHVFPGSSPQSIHPPHSQCHQDEANMSGKDGKEHKIYLKEEQEMSWRVWLREDKD